MNIQCLNNPDEFHRALTDHPCVIADFYKDHCPACRMLDLALARLSVPTAIELSLVKIQLETFGEAFFRQLSLRQTPTLIFYRHGIEVSRVMGFQTPVQLSEKVASVFHYAVDEV